MRRVTVYKAQGVDDDTDVWSLAIEAVEPFPKTSSIAETDRLHAENAGMVADALLSTLPGGTIDRLLALLLARKASSLVTALPTVEPRHPDEQRACPCTDRAR